MGDTVNELARRSLDNQGCQGHYSACYILAKVVSAAEHSSLYQAAHIACWFASPNTQVILNFPTALSLSLSEHAVVLLSHYKTHAVTRCALHFHP